MDASVRLQLVRDTFIIGQGNRTLRRHLDSVGPDTPIAEIVDRCRVWESHEEINSGRTINYEPNLPRAVFQVTQCVNNEHDETSTGFDVVENEKRAQFHRNMNYSPNGCARWHNCRCRKIPTR